MGTYYVTVPRWCGVYYLPRPITAVQYPHQDPQPAWLPLVSLSSHSKLNDTSSHTTLTQTFSNPSKTFEIPEGKFTFPLYENCVVSSFKCYVGERLVQGIVREKQQAKIEYKEAVERGETAALLEQHQPDVFTTRIGKIGAGEIVKIEIGYIMELKHDAEADGLRFTIPTAIAPRYGTPPAGAFGSEENSWTSVANDDGKKKGMKISCEIRMASNVRSVQSPSHPIHLSLGGHKPGLPDAEFNPKHAFVSLSQTSTELGKDFYLIVACSDLSSPRAILETHETIPNSKALMVTLVPKFTLPPGPKPEVVFVVDRSGSMNNKIAPLKSALEVFLKSLPVGVKFNICSFGSKHSFLWPTSKNYSADTLNEAQVHVSNFGADFGGTEILPPIQATVERRLKDIPLEVFVLTDGEVWNKESLFSFVESSTKDGSVRVFSLGIGHDVSHSLVEGLARAGRGFAQIVGGSGEGLEGKVVRMLRGGLSTHVKDYRLEWDSRPEPEPKLVASKEKEKEEEEEKSERPNGEVKKISLFDVTADTNVTPSDPKEDSKNRFASLPPFEVPQILQAPCKIPPLFPFSRSTVYCILSGSAAEQPPKSVWLKGSTEFGDQLELEIPVQIGEGRGITIHQLAARKILQELEEGTGYLHSGKFGVDPKSQPGQFSDWEDREGIRVGLKYQIASKWTSFVAVEKKKKDVSAVEIDGDKPVTPAERPDEAMDDELDYELVDFEEDTTEAHSNYPFAVHMLAKKKTGGGLMCRLAAPTRVRNQVAQASGIASHSFGSAQSVRGPVRALAAINPAPSSAPSPAFSFGGSEVPAPSSFSSAGSTALFESAVGAFGNSGNALMGYSDQPAGDLSALSFGNPRSDSMTFSGLPALSQPPLPQTPAQRTKALISLQFFEGSFVLADQLATLLGVELKVLEEKMAESLTKYSLPNEEKKQVWATALAVAMFEQKLSSEKDTWELVVEKARGWMQSVIGDATLVDTFVKEGGENLV